MRLATFNVLHGRAPVDGRVDLERFARAVAALDADVLALQEVDRGQPRSGEADLAAVAATAGGYAEHRFIPALVGLPGTWRAASAAQPDDGPAYGVALLSRRPVRSWETVRLPAAPGRVPVLFGHGRLRLVRDEPRVAALARVDLADGPVTVVCTHLSFLPVWNVVQLARLVRALRAEPRLVLAGDLNLRARAATAVSGLRPLGSGPTFPAHGPLRQLDHVLGGPGVRGEDARIWDLPLSDHRAMSVEVRLTR